MDAPSSYRPICLLPTIAMVLELVLRDRLERESEELSPQQYGFRKGRSTVSPSSGWSEKSEGIELSSVL